MMRLMAFFACLIVAADCAQTALGKGPPQIFADHLQWLWWPVALGWFVNGGYILLRGTDP